MGPNRKPPAAYSGGEVTNIRKNQFVGEYHLSQTYHIWANRHRMLNSDRKGKISYVVILLQSVVEL